MLAGIFFIATGAPAGAVTLVEGETVRFEWAPAPGPVTQYRVYVSRNGGPLEYEGRTQGDETFTVVTGEPGDDLQVQVQAISGIASASPRSDLSEVARLTGAGRPEFPDVPEPLVRPAGIRDFDVDGATDLLFMNPDTGALLAWLLDGEGVIEVSDLGEVGAGQQIVGNADYDGDGYADILLHDVTSGELELRFLVGGHLAEIVVLQASPGWRVLSSAFFLGEAGASVLLTDLANGRVQKIDAEGARRRLIPLPFDARFASQYLAGLDADGDGYPTLFYELDGTVTGHTPEGPRVGAEEAGPIPQAGLEVAGACDLRGWNEDVVFARYPGSGLHRVVLTNPLQTLRSEPVEGLTPATASLPVVSVGDWNADGRCDVALAVLNWSIQMLVLDGSGVTGGWALPSPGPDWVPIGVGAETPPFTP